MPKKKNEPKEIGANIEDTIKSIQSRFGEESIIKLGDKPKVNIGAISTGSLGLDIALGIGGVPRGRVIEIYGPESSGKTTLALHIVAQAQKKGGICAFVDAEHALDPEYSKKIGVKVDELLISQPDYGEQALDITESLVRSGKVDVIVVDSVAALTPKDEIEGDVGAHHVGKQARLMSQALRKMTALTAKSKTIVIFINQIRMQIGVMFGCLQYSSRVTLADGTQEKIGKIVNQRLPVRVLAYDKEKGKMVPAEITDWYKNGRADKFLQITAYDPSGSGVAHVACTTNHPILTPTGWKKAETLKAGDRIVISTIKRLSDFQLEIIRGSLMGDGNLSPSRIKDSLGTRFRLGHSLKQKKYLLWKASLFKNISSTTHETEKAIKFDLTPLPELFPLRQAMYKNKKKHLTPDFLAKLTPLSLAVWYQDDGGLDIRNKKKGDKGRITICVQAIAPESRLALKQLLEERYDIKTRLGIVRGQTIMYFDQANSEKFMKLIRFYIHPSMSYKILPQYRRGLTIEPKYIEPTRVPLQVPILSIKEKPSTKSMERFDIKIKNHHNFLADNIVVHNSPETTTGGKALKFYSSVRLDIRRIAQIKKGEEVVGGRVRVKVVKNKVAPPFKQAEFDVLYNEGISPEGEMLALGEKYEVISKSGASYSYKPAGENKEEIKLGRGYDAARTFLQENPKVKNEILKEIKKHIEIT